MSEHAATFVPVEEYLAWGERELRYEYVDGAVFAMSGGTRRLSRLAAETCLIVEVVLPSTEQTDRREKLVAYLNVPSLRHYLIVAQDEARIDHDARTGDGTWAFAVCGPGDSFVLTCPDTTISVDALHAAA